MSAINVQEITNGTDTITVSDTIQGTAKAWAYVASIGAVLRGFNISAITDGSTPDVYNVTFTTAMNTADYVVVGTGKASTSGTDGVHSWFTVVSQTTGGFVYQIRTTNSATLPGVGRNADNYFVCYE